MWKWLFAAIEDWSIIAAAMALVYCYPGILSVLVALFIIGNRQHAIAILGHDGAHRLACPKDKKLNDFLTNLFSFWPLFVDLEPYRKFHFDHHRYLGTTRDPEIMWKGHVPGGDEPLTLWIMLRNFVLDFLGRGMLESKWFMDHYKPSALASITFWLIVGILCISVGLWWVPVIFNVAFFTTYWCFFRLRVYTEHWGTIDTHRFHKKPSFWRRALYLPHNTWMHWEHHADPKIPFSKLKIGT